MSIYTDYWTKPTEQEPEEEMIDLSTPDGYNEFVWDQINVWRNSSPLSE